MIDPNKARGLGGKRAARGQGERGVVRLAAALALAGSVGVVLSSCAMELAAEEGVGAVVEGIQCTGKIGGTITCPPDDDCGYWKCGSTTTATCVFFVNDGARVGTECRNTEGTGRCAIFTAGARDELEYLACCTGCIDRDGKCAGGSQDAACGESGGNCKVCGTCSTCDSGACEITVGVGCTAGNNAGRCMENAVCCTGCIDGGVCYSNAVDHCGSGGGSCDDCKDDNDCTKDECISGSCRNDAVGSGSTCNDDDQCTTGDSCSGTTCGGVVQPCDDNNVCTTNDCDPQDGCQNDPTNQGGMCDDFDACTQNDSCDAGECEGQSITCNDFNTCTTDTCDPETGCKFTALDAGDGCDDGNPCTNNDVCVVSSGEPIKCQGTGAGVPSCGPGQMPVGACGAQTCQNKDNTTPCSTGTLCAIGETCTDGVCGSGLPINCNDGSPCTTDSCDDALGCQFTPDPTSAGDECNDGDLCTFNDVCTAEGACAGSAVDCSARNDCYEPGTCEAESGTCLERRKRDGTACGESGMCDGGECVGDGVVGAAGSDGSGGTTASGGSSGEPGEGGTSGTDVNAGEGSGASAGEDGGGGEPGSGASSGNGTSGRTGSGASSGQGTGGTQPKGPLYVREPGGCAVGGTPSAGGLWMALAGALAALAGTRRRRRGAPAAR
ncbi:MAG TPA: hypothetical protein VGK73_35755 [Polyangiaceae bacterium]